MLWHDGDGTRATLWNFTERTVTLDGAVTDATTGVALPAAATYALQACHTYVITGAMLPKRVGEAAAV